MIASTLNRENIGRLLTIAFVLAALAASLVLAAKPSYASTTFTVTNTNDSASGR